MDNLVSKIENLIEYEKGINPDIEHLEPHHATLIAQIISNYKLSKKPTSESKPEAKMIFCGAPTGAGKDTLVRKIMNDNKDNNFVVLNMDMFRHYHNEIIGSNEFIPDRDYAKITNQTSYELYYIIQELILQEFPGTSVIVTGTMRDLDWVKEILTRYKKDKKTNYTNHLVTLAVPIKESGFSIFERYLDMVDTREDSSTPLRFTDLVYHNDTVQKFFQNMQVLENDFKNPNEEKLFETIRVYKRSQDILDLSEDTLVYDSQNPTPDKCAYAHIFSIMHAPHTIAPERISNLLRIIEENADYLKAQGLYNGIGADLKNIISLQAKVVGDDDDVSK